jgi:peptidoglycan/LPS O-acetylase OafA/YrhL
MLGSTKLRAEIQGLRALAVSVVLVFHLWPAQLKGGYVGVDVFFVISGYLITKHLLTELETSGRLSVTEFWARRARRLLPASLLVLATSAGATLLWVPAGLAERFLREVAASALYVQNWQLARDAVDYFAESNEPSPVQHFWTLSVEEQFYFALPLLLLGVLAATGRGGTFEQRRRVAGLSLALTVSASFAYALVNAASEPAPTYFSTPARAFEFGAGALLSFAGPPGKSWVRVFVAWSGLGGIVAGVWLMGQVEPFDPAATCLSILGTLAILWAGDGGGFEPARLSRVPPLQFLGAISYSLYLWHWPLIVLLPFALGRPLADLDKVGVLLASVGLAWLTTRWVEDPIRFARTRAGLHRPRVVASWSAAGMSVVLGLTAIGLGGSAPAQPDVGRLAAQDPACFGAAAMRTHRESCSSQRTAVVPKPSALRFDVVHRPDCRVESQDTELRMCSLGPHTRYDKRLAVLGDSHAAALLPAFEVIAHERGWRIDLAAKNACYWTSATQPHRSPANKQACEDWKTALNRRLGSEPPYDAILVTHSVSHYPPEGVAGATREETIVNGLLDSWRRQAERGTRIIAIRDNPVAGAETLACVLRNLSRANELCSFDRRAGLAAFDGNIGAVRLLPGSHLVDLSDYYCHADTCPPIIGNVIVYRDADHITATFARTLAPFLMQELDKVLD